MHELFLLWAMMVFTFVVMGALIYVFKDWFKERDRLVPPVDRH